VRLVSLYSELKRRNVFRVAAAYIVVGWLILQVADIVFDFIHAPEWAGKAVVALLVLGFIPAVAVAWIFEVTPEGVRRDDGTSHDDGHHRARRLDIITIVAVLIVAGITFWEQMQPAPKPGTAPAVAKAPAEPPKAAAVAGAQQRPPQPIVENSIAVLPFANRSAEPESAFFVDGVHDDLLTQLARIGSLKVISRTSVMEYRGTTKNMRQIGQELGVATILEGAVQRAGNRVRITAQLIDSETDEHLWADSFDRELTTENVFDIQTDIARSIATALVTTLTPDQLASIGKDQPTNVQAAYDLYLQARAREDGSDAVEIRKSLALYEQAVALDPDFALAIGEMGYEYTNLYWFWTQDPADRQKGAELIERALALAPDEPRLHWIRADHLYHGYLDYEGALAELARAEMGNPNGSEIYQLRGWILRRQGDFAGAIEALEKSIQLDPRNVNTIADHAWTYAFQGDIQAARVWSARLRTIPGVNAGLLSYGPGLEFLVAGNMDPIKAYIDEYSNSGWGNLNWVAIEVPLVERRYADALDAVADMPDDPLFSQWVLWPKSLMRARIRWAEGDLAAAGSEAEQALADLEPVIEELPDNARPVAARAMALAILGREEEARAEAIRATELYPITGDVPMAAAYHADRLKVLALVADTEELAREMAAYLALKAKIHYVDYLLLDPVFDRHRDHPAIQALERRYTLRGDGA
jgi:TolB-like protein/Tfp pilus assembly protein PilF